jgi:predicted transcriptional regulator
MADTESEAAAGGSEMLSLASKIVAAYVGRNSVPVPELPAMIKAVHGTLCGLVGRPGGDGATTQKPAVPIKRSITPDYIVCLEDGRKLKMLKRYLNSSYSLTPDQYRAKWGLPRDYPMVAPNYSARRSDFAKKIGLGRTKKTATGKRRKKA